MDKTQSTEICLDEVCIVDKSWLKIKEIQI